MYYARPQVQPFAPLTYPKKGKLMLTLNEIMNSDFNRCDTLSSYKVVAQKAQIRQYEVILKTDMTDYMKPINTLIVQTYYKLATGGVTLPSYSVTQQSSLHELASRLIETMTQLGDLPFTDGLMPKFKPALLNVVPLAKKASLKNPITYP
jgi:hypothetical protein